MELREVYEKLEGNYEEVLGRLMKDDRILKYLKKFLDATDFENLKKALAEEDWQNAFMYSHNLKGNCMNLGMGSLYKPASELCENLRGGSPKEDCAPLMEKVEEKYYETINTIKEL